MKKIFPSMRVAIDTGGTFTDCVFVRAGRLEILKVLSTPANPAHAIAEALQRAQEKTVAAKNSHNSQNSIELLHGTTVGTNTLLTRTGARVALVTTEGFEDVLAIGRQAREQLYDFSYQRPAPLIPPERRLGVAERAGPRGEILTPLKPAVLKKLLARLQRMQPDTVALSFLFSYVNPTHERQVARVLRREGWPVSVSHEVLPEFREYERTATVAVNAYLMPVMGRYLGEIEKVVRGLSGRGGQGKQSRRVSVMQSNGGTVSARLAAVQPVRTVLSGPAGGVVGARYVAQRAGLEKIITFDMGGTSTDVALIGSVRADSLTASEASKEGSVAGLPVAVPMLDIHTVGAGGGSLAWLDPGGALRVGPQSAGADPGPICYGQGTEPTVTDAHLILGRLDPAHFLGGQWKLEEGRTRQHMKKAASSAGFPRTEKFAAGIVAVANATMERAIRVISVERGHDPRDFALVAFGGAGALHACELAESLQISRVLVPKFPGALSALGILRSDVLRDYSRTLLLPAEATGLARKLEVEFRRLEQKARAEMRQEGFAVQEQRLQRQIDVRYQGQGYELTVPYSAGFLKAFHRAHEQRYSYADENRPAEVVGVRVRALGVTEKPALPRHRVSGPNPSTARVKTAPVWFGGRAYKTDFFVREKLRTGNRFRGPAIVAEYSATTAIPPGWAARVDAYGNLLLEQEKEK